MPVISVKGTKQYDALTHKLAFALEEYEAGMGLESLTHTLAMCLLACAARTAESDTIEYPIETDFASGSVVVRLVSKD